MKKKTILLGIIIMCVLGAYVSARNTYNSSWKKVEDLEKKSLPASALTEVDKIYQSAIAEKNNPQIIKALIHKMKYESESSADNWPEVFQQVEKLLTETKNVTEKSILHSMMAEMYMQYYTSRSHQINQRSDITGYVPEKMDEWSKNIFLDKFTEHLKASLQPAKELQQLPATEYADVITLGDDSRTLRPSLFDFLSYRALNLLNNNQYSISVVYGSSNLESKDYFAPVESFLKVNIPEEDTYEAISLNVYKQLLAFHQQDKNKDALLHSDLERIKFVHQVASIASSDELYENYLSTLEKEYAGNPLCVEVMAQQADYYFSNAYQFVNDKSKISAYYTKAYNICEKGIELYPTYKRKNLLKNIKAQIEQPNLVATTNDVNYPNKEIEFSIQYKNLTKGTLKIYRVDKSAQEYATENYSSGIDKIPGTLILTQNVDFEIKEKFAEQQSKFNIKGLPYGIYHYEILPDDKTARTSKGNFAVSKYTLLKRIRENKAEYYVVDRISGHPETKATVKIFENKFENRRNAFKLLTSIPVDGNGCVNYTFSKSQNIYAGISVGDDVYFPLRGLYLYNVSTSNAEKEQTNISLFTDRNIYRPGQTLYFKGIVYKQSYTDLLLEKNKEFEVKLFDANNQEVSSRKLKTNNFGSFAGEFILPQDVLSGSFYLKCNDAYYSFKVEEYKRPSIEVTFHKIQGTFSFGNLITLRGSVMNYAGFANGNIAVKYRIVKQNPFIWWPRTAPVEVTNGTVITDADGKFTVNFTPEKGDEKNATTLSYTLYVETTDSKGETQGNQFNFMVSDNSIVLSVDIPAQVRKGTNNFMKVNAENTNGEKIEPFVTYAIFSAETKKSFTDTLTMSKEPILEGGIDLSETDKLYYTLFNQLPSGSYRIVFSAKDAQNRISSIKNDFYLYALDDTRLSTKMYVFKDEIKTECAIGENAEILFGTALTDAKVLYQIRNNEKLFESRWIDFNNEIRKLTIPYKQEYGDEVSLDLVFVRDEMIFNQVVKLTRVKEDKTLNVVLTSFRDKLLPGQQEEWTVKITDHNNKVISAELLTSLYDASLDQFTDSKWNFKPSLLKRSSLYTAWSIEAGRMAYASANFNVDYKNIEQLKFDEFNWFGLDFLNKEFFILGTGGMRASTSSRRALNSDVNYMVKMESVEDQSMPSAAVEAPIESEVSAVRQNFNETAFFYPQLKTNKDGEVLISFTIPESLTRWNFRGLAHTDDLQYGQIEASTVTQKPFMISANMPRFVRVGDKLVLNATVANMTSDAIQGQARLDVMNPLDNTVVFTASAAFKCDANSTAPVNWEYNVNEKHDVLICRVTANNNEFSDGEQHMLPVLSNKILITESMLMNVNGNDTKQFTFQNMKNTSSTIENKSFSIEFTANPAWYAVQALPYLSTPTDDNTVSFLTAYYVNTVAGYIANSNPELSAVFEQWRTQTGGKDALLSSLDKNQELKNILLQETPWVMEAKDESEQKQRIALLFDLNNLKHSTESMFAKVKDMQLTNGAFVWFKGMDEDRYVTQFAIDVMTRLQQMNAVTYTDTELNLLQGAIKYIDLCIKDDYAKFQKSKSKTDELTAIQIYYHYIRSAHQKIQIASDVKDAYNYYLLQMEKQWTKRNLYEQAMTAIVMKRTGKTNVANDIIASLRERATVSDELGMYWDKNRSSYLWSESAINTQATIIEAFKEVAGNESEIDNMKKWLLKQKQSQKWDSEISSVNAIYALLQSGNNWLTNKGDVQVAVGGQKVIFNEQEAGTGYVKKTYSSQEITPELADITIAKQDAGMAWGAAYWQYLENIDKIEKTKGDFSIDKKLFVEKTNNRGRSQEAITDKTQLKVGDKVTVRLTVRTDRDLEYVFLKDLRAACFEPVQPLSGYRFNEGIGYYQSPKDVSVQYFFNRLPKGTYVFEYSVYVTRTGDYSNGMATIQCQYAPEFVSHSGAERIRVVK